MPKHIHYIHLNTGNAQRLEPLSVDDTMVAMARAWLDQDGLHRDIIPGLRFDFLSTAIGGAVFCTLKRSSETLAEFGIAKRSGGAAAMWADLLDGREGVKGDPEKPPQAPWLALYWLPAMGRQPREIAVATIAIAKACAWAWIEKRDS